MGESAVEYATGASSQLRTMPAINAIGTGISCIFGGIGSALTAINSVGEEEVIEDIRLDLANTCAAEVVYSLPPIDLRDPTNFNNLAWSLAGAGSLRLARRIESKAFRLDNLNDRIVIFPRSSPAYPSTWRDLPGPRF